MKSGVAAVKPQEGTSAVAPAASKARATCTDSSTSSPPDMPSSRFILTSTGKSGPRAPRTPATTSTGKRQRFSSDPP